ncbi:MAG: IclR family transcriptional regulator [Thermodesulfobacteriota bacterium]
MANQSIQRAARILSLFSYSRPQMGVSEIAKEVDMPVGTVHGLVRTLEEEGFLSQDPKTRKYRLGMRLHELGSIHMATLEINQKATIPLSYLARDTGLVGRLGVLERDVLVVTLDTMPMGGSLAAPYIGAAAPAYCTSMGRAILAFLPLEEVEGYLERVELVKYTPHTITDPAELRAELARTRERGYSLSRQEFLLNLESLGVPIFQEGGQVCCALSLNGEPERLSQAELAHLARKAMDTAGEISRYLGHYQYLDPRRRRA